MIDKNSCPEKDNNDKCLRKKFGKCPEGCICNSFSNINCTRKISFVKKHNFFHHGINLYYQKNSSLTKILDYLLANVNYKLFKLSIKYSENVDISNISKYINLKILILENNPSIHPLNDSLFFGLKYLIHLNLRNNSIDVIDENLFKHQKFLQYLDLSSNKFESFPKNLFEKLQDLRYLYMENMIFQHLDNNLFSFSVNLKSLFMKNTKIIRLLDLKFVIFKNTKALKSLSSDYFVLCCFTKRYRVMTDCVPEETIYSFCGQLIYSFTLKGYLKIFCLFFFFSI